MLSKRTGKEHWLCCIRIENKNKIFIFQKRREKTYFEDFYGNSFDSTFFHCNSEMKNENFFFIFLETNRRLTLNKNINNVFVIEWKHNFSE